MNEPLSPDAVVVFSGPRGACAEFGLVLEARAIPFEVVEWEGGWALTVAPYVARAAQEEVNRYTAERAAARRSEAAKTSYIQIFSRRFGGAGYGAVGFAFTLLFTAYAAGSQWFGVDWYDAGAIEAQGGLRQQWWRAVTALTLHLDQEHLFGNLLFGIGAGVLCSRIFGTGLAWLGILAAGTCANCLELFFAPLDYRAVGASTAVFAGLGLLAGYAWRQRLPLRERWIYRGTPLIAGLFLLALLGAGNEHVDVLGHLLGFASGLALGWTFARLGVPRTERAGPQVAAAAAAALVIVTAWVLALAHSSVRAG
jgi:membrane associated rhomboid family serine protease